MKIQYPKGTHYTIGRPANVYGRFDNLNAEEPMVITSLIKKALAQGEGLSVWGDGTQIRDFINARDVARAMILIMEKNPSEPIDIGSGVGVTIREIADIIGSETQKQIIYDKTKPRGAENKVMRVEKLRALGFCPKVIIREGIKEIIKQWKEK